MTRKERMFAAIRQQPLDHVPYATYNCHPYSDNEHTSDPSYAEILERVRATCGVYAKVGAPGLGVGLTRQRDGVEEIFVEGSGDDRTQRQVVHTPKGDLVSIRRIPENKPGMVIKHLVATDDEVERYLSRPYEVPEFDLTPVRAFLESASDGAILMVGYSEPMYATAKVMGFEAFSMRCLEDMPTIRRLLDWSFERCKENLRSLVSACSGMDVSLMTGGPEICTPPMMPPAYFGELVTPHMRQLVEIIHAAALPATLHCHGRLRDVLPEIIKTGIDLLEPLEPPDQGDIALAELFERAGGKLCLMGYIQDQEFYTAPPGRMTRRVEEIARVVDGRTGYIMTPTCTPFEHPCGETYKRNYLEWLDAAERILGGA